jgi:hypothetical protein
MTSAESKSALHSDKLNVADLFSFELIFLRLAELSFDIRLAEWFQ